MTTASDLIRLKQKIDDSKQTKANIEGKIEGLYEQLEEQFGCKTLASANKKIKSLEREFDAKQDQLEDGLAGLEEKYEWG